MNNKSVYIKKTIILLITVSVLVFTDWITKQLAVNNLIGHPISVIPDFFKLELLYNSGAAFGMLKDSRVLFCILTFVLCIFIVIIYYRTPDGKRYTMLKAVLLVLFAGAIGNFIDRIQSGFVTDFLSFKFGSYYFPTFNVADIYVTTSGFALFFLIIFYYKDSELSVLFRRNSNKGGLDEGNN